MEGCEADMRGVDRDGKEKKRGVSRCVPERTIGSGEGHVHCMQSFKAYQRAMAMVSHKSQFVCP